MSDALKIIMIIGFSIFCFVTVSRKLYKVLEDKNDYTLIQRFYAINTVSIILALIVYRVTVSSVLRMLSMRSEVLLIISIAMIYGMYRAIKFYISKDRCYKNELSCLENLLIRKLFRYICYISIGGVLLYGLIYISLGLLYYTMMAFITVILILGFIFF